MIKWIEKVINRFKKPQASKTYVVVLNVHAYNEKFGRKEVITFATTVKARSRRIAEATCQREMKLKPVKAYLLK